MFKIKNAKNAFTAAVNDKQFCSIQPNFCQDISYTQQPLIIAPIEQPSVALFVGSMIGVFERQVKNKQSITTPPGIENVQTIIADFDNIPEDPRFGYAGWDDVNGILFIIYRGTLTKEEFQQDADFRQVDINQFQNNNNFPIFQNETLVHRGFLRIFLSIKSELDAIFLEKKNQITQIVISGHSLGGAEASLTSAYICGLLNSGYFSQNPQVIVYTFGKPRVGDFEYSNVLTNQMNSSSRFFIRIENVDDLVVTIPLCATPNLQDNQTPWIYNHEGLVKRFEKNLASLGLNHFMQVYLTAYS